MLANSNQLSYHQIHYRSPYFSQLTLITGPVSMGVSPPKVAPTEAPLPILVDGDVLVAHLVLSLAIQFQPSNVGKTMPCLPSPKSPFLWVV